MSVCIYACVRDRERARERESEREREEPVVIVSFVSNRVDFVALQLEGLKTYLRSAFSSHLLL